MTAKQHKTMAFSLAFLILISTTGFSVNMLFCSCTGKQYLATLASKLHLDCCKVELAEAAQNCSVKVKPTVFAQSVQQDEFQVITKKNCCSNSFKWAKANINLEVTNPLEFPTFILLPVFNYVKQPAYDVPFAVFPKTIALAGYTNKAPPLRGVSIQNWFQIYRC